jgi:hypothetical protein
MKVKLFILHFLFILCAIIEFLWSIVVSVFESIGLKLTELVDVIQASISKTKEV